MNKKPKVGYLTFGRDDFGYGMALCLSELDQCELYRVTPKTARLVDWLCFSCFWWEHIYILADFLRSAGINKKDDRRPRIIVGGFNTANPVPFLAYADYVIVGDGEGTLKAIIQDGNYDASNILTSENRTVKYGAAELRSFCHETNDIARIEIARGCKAKCKFCAVTHLKPYRELAIDKIKEALKTTKMKRVSFFAPEPTMHSADLEISSACHALGKTRVDSDVRLDRLSLRSDSVPRVGIEGLSERLRKSIKKPYSNEVIIEAIRTAIKEGRKGIFMYLILDLPGEEIADWEEFSGLCRKIGELPGAANFVLKPSPSVFLPTPHTPMEYCGIHWDRDYGEQWKKFFGRGDEREWEVIMAERSRVFSPHMRLLSMVSTRAGIEFSEIERFASFNKAIAISGGRLIVPQKRLLEKIIEKFGGIEKYCGDIEQGPWKICKLSSKK